MKRAAGVINGYILWPEFLSSLLNSIWKGRRNERERKKGALLVRSMELQDIMFSSFSSFTRHFSTGMH